MSLSPSTEVLVRVPATAANLGPGLDSLGVALELFNVFRMRRDAARTATRIHASGEGVEELASTGEENLVYQAVRRLYAEAGISAPPGRSISPCLS